jgi:hypothetical protein
MLRWLVACVALCSAAFVAVSAAMGMWPHVALKNLLEHAPEVAVSKTGENQSDKVDKERDHVVFFGETTPSPTGQGVEPVVINDATVAVIEFQEVPCERDGMLLFVARGLRKGDEKLREQILRITLDPECQDSKTRQRKLADYGLVEEKLTYLGVRIPEKDVQRY